MTKFKKAIGKIHLWLGLASGLVVFIVAITGCIYVFRTEISEITHHRQLFVKPRQSALPLSSLQAAAQDALGKGQPINFITTYKDATRAWEFGAFKAGKPDAVTYFGAVNYYRVAYVDPYTGAVTGVIDYKYEFFSLVKYLHWSLLLNTPYGQPIVGYATLIFVIMLITGLILWWPKKWNKANMQKSFKVKWSAGYKRVNYDLHNVPGFYAMLIALIISMTGMVWALGWFQKAVYVVASLSVTPPDRHETRSTPAEFKGTQKPIDIAYAYAYKVCPDADRIGVNTPFGKEDVISVSAYRGKEVYYNYDELRFDQYTGAFLYREDFKQKNRGQKLIGMNYDIHVGAILGLPGKILAFIASLIAASLPITGFMIWLNRKKKKKYVPIVKKQPNQIAAV